MKPQRSTTDEQLAARWDKEPWLVPEANSQGAYYVRFSESTGADSKYDPRPECIPSRDPLAFVRDESNGHGAFRHRHNPNDAGLYPWCKFAPRPWGTFTPDSKFARPPVNPILSAFRGQQYIKHLLPKHATAWLASCRDMGIAMGCTPDQVDFARAVLTRLAALSE